MKTTPIIVAILFLLISPESFSQTNLPYVADLAWSPTGNYFARIFDDYVDVVQIDGGDVLYRLQEQTGRIFDVAWSNNGMSLATASEDQTIVLWDMTNGTSFRTLTGQQATIGEVWWSPDNTFIIGYAFDTIPSLAVWEVNTGKMVLNPNGGAISDGKFSADGKLFAVANFLSLTILDAVNFKVLRRSPTIECCTNQMISLAWSNNSSKILTGSLNGLVTVWDANSMQILDQYEANTSYAVESFQVSNLALSWVRSVSFTSNSEIAAVSGDGTFRIWNLNDRELVAEKNIGNLYTATWSQYKGVLLVLQPRESEIKSFDQGIVSAGDVVGTISEIVPIATLERFSEIAASCDAPAALSSFDTSLQAEAMIDAQAETLIAQLDALPDGAIPLGCEADLRAIAEAIGVQSGQ